MSVCQARGAALAVCGTHGITCTEYAPTQVKTTVCGFGGADKSQVMRMVRQLLSLPAAPESEHAADALAVALCHAWVGEPAPGAADGTMIASLRGRLAVEGRSTGSCIEVGGVGLRVHASSAAAGRASSNRPELVAAA